MLYRKKSFQGTWAIRMQGLSDLPVEFAGATVLDVGCNMGIIGYEICKRKPAFFHGVEAMLIHSFVAKMVFQGVEAENRIDRFDITKENMRRKKLLETYDIILYLAVHQHLRKQVGAVEACKVAIDLFSRCRGSLVFRGPHLDEISEIGESCGLLLKKTIDCGLTNKLALFQKPIEATQ